VIAARALPYRSRRPVGAGCFARARDRSGGPCSQPEAYGIALLFMIISMLCWGPWANTMKLTPGYAFQLFAETNRMLIS
jgi:hypothetical protein